MTLLVSPDEVRLLNFYRVSELEGGLALGRLAQQVRDADLIGRLTEHAAEEVLHAQYWTETIIAVGGVPTRNDDTYQSRYAEVLRPPTSALDVLVLTQVFERTVFRHFTAHLRRPGTHPVVQATLRQMLADERDHLDWVKQWIAAQSAKRRAYAAALMARYTEVDAVILAELLQHYGWTRAA